LSVEIGTYLYAIAQNIWLSNLRKKSSVTIIDDESVLSDSVEDVDDMEEHLELEKKHNYVADALKSMKEECRNIIEAAFYKKLSGSEIAKLLGYTESFVKVKKFRCLEELRKKMINDK
jgi:RNA polymerase sigma factor (sigma-70 family)